MSPGQLSQVAGGRPLAHSVSGQLVHDRGHRWTSENIGGQKCLLVEFAGQYFHSALQWWALEDIVYFFYTHGL